MYFHFPIICMLKRKIDLEIRKSIKEKNDINSFSYYDLENRKSFKNGTRNTIIRFESLSVFKTWPIRSRWDSGNVRVHVLKEAY